jgi:hypothetical protein
MKRNRTFTGLSLMLLFAISFAMAQPNEPSRERLKSLKIAFITERLELTSGEAQQFWPLYNAFEEQMLLLGNQERAILRNGQGGNLSESEADTQLKELLGLRAKRCMLEKEFFSDLKGVLPGTKIIRLAGTEEEFKRRLLQRYREGQRRRRN